MRRKNRLLNSVNSNPIAVVINQDVVSCEEREREIKTGVEKNWLLAENQETCWKSHTLDRDTAISAGGNQRTDANSRRRQPSHLCTANNRFLRWTEEAKLQATAPGSVQQSTCPSWRRRTCSLSVPWGQCTRTWNRLGRRWRNWTVRLVKGARTRLCTPGRRSESHVSLRYARKCRWSRCTL